MKYLKVTAMAFIVSLVLGLSGVNATQYVQIVNAKIPIFSGEFVSKQVDKGSDFIYTQKVKLTYVSDDLTGDGRVLLGSIYHLIDDYSATPYQQLIYWQNVDFGSSTLDPGPYKLRVKSKKSLPTTVTASFDWDLGTITSTPYPGVGL